MFAWILKSFQRQITVILLAFGMFIITSFLVLDYPKEKQQIREILEHQVSEFATNLALLIADDVRYNKFFILSDRLEKIYNNNLNQHSNGLLFKIIQIAVVDNKDYIMGHTKPANYPLQTPYQHPDLPRFATDDVAGHHHNTDEHIHSAIKWIVHENRLLVKSPIILGNEVIGSVIVDTDTSAIIALENALIEDILITFIILFIVVFVLSHLFALWIGKPLQQIIKNIDSIGSGKLKLPFINQRSDEFQILGSAITDTDKRLYQQTSELMHEQSTLEIKVKERTQELESKTNALNDSLETLNQTQNDLIESAKMASLGELVAGVAHEINTPIGVCLTGASHVKDETTRLVASLNSESLTEVQLNDYISSVDQISDYMLVSLNKASDLIRSFKQVSADQNIDEKHMFDLHEYINVILISQQNMLKKSNVLIENLVPEKLVINSYAGIFYQIITNFIANSLLHGYDNDASGRISISAELNNRTLQLIYEDDGKGMDKETLKKIFEPFFTTKRTSGGTGLGMHIIFNLVTHKLKGNIKAESDINQGMRIDITIPV